MKAKSRRILIGMIAAGIGATLPATASDMANPLFGYAHQLPSPATLPAGRLHYGTEVALGVTDFFQVGTNLLRLFYKYYNLNAKVALVDTPDFALSLTAGWEHYNMNDIHPLNPDLKITSFLPGVVTAFALHPRFALISGANLAFTRADFDLSGLETSGYTRGARLASDVVWAYNPGTKKKAMGNVLAAGVSYDISYHLIGIGFSHHWPGFQLGIHYYPNADRYKVQPIVSGGGVMNF